MHIFIVFVRKEVQLKIMEQIVKTCAAEIASCRLFKGLDMDETLRALSLLGASAADYPRNAFLHRAGEPLSRFGLVLSGLVQVLTDDINGNRMIMANVTTGGTFGESLCYLKVREPEIYIVAQKPSRVLWLSAGPFRQEAETAFVLEMKDRFISMLAERALSMNTRIQILSRLTIRDKLNALFTAFADRDGRTVTLPFDRADMAAYLGADRSALSRELSRMKAEGLIDYHRNRITLL